MYGLRAKAEHYRSSHGIGMVQLWHPTDAGLAGVQGEHGLSVNAVVDPKWVAAEAVPKYTPQRRLSGREI